MPDPEEWVVVFHNGAVEAGTFEVRGFAAKEQVSGLFEIELQLQVEGEVPFDEATISEILQAPSAVGVASAGEARAPYFGVLRELELLDVVEGRYVLYRAWVVPSLWYATQTHRTRVFQELSVPEIVSAVLRDSGLAPGPHVDLALTGSYPKREYIVQYEESDYAFLARLLEHEGIFFYFDFAEGTDRVVVGDHPGAFCDAELASIPYGRGRPAAGEMMITTLGRRYPVVPRTVVLRDSNWRTPLVPLQADAEVRDDGVGLVAEYGDHFTDEGEGRRIAKVRAEALALAAKLCPARGQLFDLRAGQCFRIEGHESPELDGLEVVVLEANHVHSEVGFESNLLLLPRAVPFRPARETPKPRIFGLMHARVDGEIDGTAAPIDEHGRYRVLLPFDAEGRVGGRASRWIRRLSPYAGPSYGMHFPLHVGSEVLIAHLGGDPDRPIIVGAAPNPSTLSPVLAENATQSVIRTKGHIVEEYEDDA